MSFSTPFVPSAFIRCLSVLAVLVGLLMVSWVQGVETISPSSSLQTMETASPTPLINDGGIATLSPLNLPRALAVCGFSVENTLYIRSEDNLQKMIDTYQASKKYLIVESRDMTGQLQINPNPPEGTMAGSDIIEICAANNDRMITGNKPGAVRIRFSNPVAPSGSDSEAPFLLVTDAQDKDRRYPVILRNLIMEEYSDNAFLLCSGFDVDLRVENSLLISQLFSQKVVQGFDSRIELERSTITGDYDIGIRIRGGQLTLLSTDFTHSRPCLTSRVAVQLRQSAKPGFESEDVRANIGGSEFLSQQRAVEVIGGRNYLAILSSKGLESNTWYVNQLAHDLTEEERVSGIYTGNLSWETSVNNRLQQNASTTAMSVNYVSLLIFAVSALASL